ncbi:MAG: PD-(D/E)XK nuclease family protein, partial [Nitrosomonadales bacterium]|nr:PD-(D/E)XK nuclease family protein [Nitrosomonadales bacterium]
DIGLAGFDRISPLQQRLFDAMRARDVNVETHSLVFGQPQIAHRVELNDQDAECRAAVAWAKCQLERSKAARLAIVVPELSALRDKLASLLDEAFQPDTVTPQSAQSPRTYDFSLGVPLSTQPVIAAALNLLRFGFQRQAIPQSDISELLHNPYWSGGFSEADARAQLDAAMREWLPLSLTPQRFQHFVQKLLGSENPLLVARLNQDLQTLLKLCQSQSSRQQPSAWAAAFKTILHASHWPGERSLSSVEYQAIQSFEKALKALADLDQLSGSINAAEAIKRLAQLCKEQIFQPEAQDVPQLQVLGMLEAAAEPLDAMWVMGMNDHVWPPAPNPNPLLPAQLQRSAGTPNADSRVQMEFAEAIHRRLLASASSIVFSSALKDGERMLRLSPLLQNVPLASNSYPLFSTLAETFSVDAPRHLHFLDDAQAPAIQEGEHVSGGTGLLKAQAICPAWAFYQYRLHARALKSPVNGLDAMERGTLVHAVLERFWVDRTLHDLLTMSVDELEAAVSEAADQALVAFNEECDASLSPAFISLERGRLVKLTLAWLREVEMQRPMDFAVTAREQDNTVLIEGITIRLVVDRIDTLEDGRLVLLDYKTGLKNDYKNWAESRITEPQLPIYAAFVLSANEKNSEIAAICYAQVRIDKNCFAGIAYDEDRIQGALVLSDAKCRKIFSETDFPDWQSLLNHWKSSIESIARELKSGEASIRFADEKQLAYCEILPLLRLPERQLQFERPELIKN